MGANISWETVGVACGINIVLTGVVIIIFVLVNKRIGKRRRSQQKRQRVENRDTSQDLSDFHDIVKQSSHKSKTSESSFNTDRDSQSGQPLLLRPVSQQPPAKLTTIIGENFLSGKPVDSRRKYHGDFIASWCTKHGLSEQTAEVLRNNGFLHQHHIDSLNNSLVEEISLPNKAEKGVLLLAIEQHKKQNADKDKVLKIRPDSHAKPMRYRTENAEIRYSTDSGIDGRMNQSQCSNNLSDDTGCIPSDGFRQRCKSNDETYQVASSQARQVNNASSIKKTSSNFHGLLSDKGLFQMANDLGVEWNELACVLQVPFPVQEKLQLDNPNNSRKQIAGMLRWWRDHQNNDKLIVKGNLHRALLSIGKTDIAAKLMKEQVDGSNENITYNAVI